MKLRLTRKEQQILEEWAKLRSSDPRQAKGLALLLAARNTSRSDIAKSLGFSYQWVCSLISLFCTGGIKAITPKQAGRPPKGKEPPSNYEQANFGW